MAKYVKGLAPTWADVLNIEKDDSTTYFGHISEAIKLATELGYPLISWNGRIYEIEGKKWIDTGWIAEEI